MRRLFYRILFLFCLVSPVFGILALSGVTPLAPREDIVWIGVNEFLYVDRFDPWNIVEVGYRRGITAGFNIGIKTWMLGVLGCFQYTLMGDPNYWFRFHLSVDGGAAYHPVNRIWLSTAEAALSFDVTLAKPVRAYFSTGWRFISSTEHPFWRLSAGVWIRLGSWNITPEISMIRFAQFDPILPPFYFNPALSVGLSF